MNRNYNIITAGIAGTTCMTLFSYIVSEKKNRNFREPQLLAQLIFRLMPVNKKSSKIAGWLLHYATGILFAKIYSTLIRKAKLKKNVPSALITGGVSGVIAVVVWHTVFKLHPHPPRTAFNKYYGHLIVTHIVFSAATFAFLDE